MKRVVNFYSIGGRHTAQLECGHDAKGVVWPVPSELACLECELPPWVIAQGRDSRFSDVKAAFEAAKTSLDPVVLDELGKDRRWWHVQAAVAQNPATSPETVWWLSLEPVEHIQVMAVMGRRKHPHMPEEILRRERQKRATARWRRDGGDQNVGGNAYGTIASPHD